jgi:hypothetical protein
MFNSKLSEDDKLNIKQWALSGIGYTDIVKRLDSKVSKQRIKQLCQKWGIDAFDIKRNIQEVEYIDNMTRKWGKEWNNKEHRQSLIYQTMRTKFSQKRANAMAKGQVFTIDFGDIDFPQHCPILGIPLNYFNEAQDIDSPSFDCKNPSMGYVKGNVFIISMRANRIKNDGTAAEHGAIARYMTSET